jgi:hypothetical protein
MTNPKWRIIIDDLAEEQADSIIEVLSNAEGEGEIKFTFDILKVDLEE